MTCDLTHVSAIAITSILCGRIDIGYSPVKTEEASILEANQEYC